jgi:hypothetical protein
VTGHSAYLNAWVFTAIGGTKPERGERVSLPEFLDGADYFNRAVISKDELEHGVRDLVAAELISVAGQSFALTDAGRDTWKSVWRTYEARRSGNHPIAVAEERLKSLPCAADDGDWSLTEQDFDRAVATYRTNFRETLGSVDPKLAASMDQGSPSLADRQLEDVVARVRARHPSLRIDEVMPPFRSAHLPIQQGLRFAISLSAQRDELHLSVGDLFWVEYFPSSKPGVVEEFEARVNGLISGECRIVESYIGARGVSARLECRHESGRWKRRATWRTLRSLLPLRRRERLLHNVGP